MEKRRRLWQFRDVRGCANDGSPTLGEGSRKAAASMGLGFALTGALLVGRGVYA